MTQSSIEARLARLEGAQAIQNVMSRYSLYLTALRFADIVDLFALEQADVRAEMGFGVFEGAESIRRLYAGFHAETVKGPGTMMVHALTTPVIEVAGDGKTGKGVWVSPGHVTGGPFVENGELKAHWAWMRYGADFVKQNNGWRIWHLHVFGLFICPFDQSWVETGDVHIAPEMPPQYRPDRPPTTGWGYTRDAVMTRDPVPPTPYETFDPATAF